MTTNDHNPMDLKPQIDFKCTYKHDVILRAAQLADRAHRGQMRKYWDNVPYIVHPGRVAMRLSMLYLSTSAMVAAGWLHDVLEDTKVPGEDILWECGAEVLELVQYLTNPSKELAHLPRAERKLIDREHIKHSPHDVKIIKMVDRTDNLKDLVGAPLGFVRLYYGESEALFDVLKGISPILDHEYTQAMEGLKARIDQNDQIAKGLTCSARSEHP